MSVKSEPIKIGEPGKYGPECAQLRQDLGAEVVAVMVGNGNKGSGFTVEIEARNEAHADQIARTLAGLLREVAENIESTLEAKHKWTI
jgi:hypothetical protein